MECTLHNRFNGKVIERWKPGSAVFDVWLGFKSETMKKDAEDVLYKAFCIKKKLTGKQFSLFVGKFTLRTTSWRISLSMFTTH